MNNKKSNNLNKRIFLQSQINNLLNNWTAQQISENEILFIKHFQSNRKGVLYQLILSGNEYDGLYEFELFGHDLKMENIVDKDNNEVILKIQTDGNYDLVKFKNKFNKEISYSKIDLGELTFKDLLIKQNYITEDEYNKFSKSSLHDKICMSKNMKKINLF